MWSRVHRLGTESTPSRHLQRIQLVPPRRETQREEGIRWNELDVSEVSARRQKPNEGQLSRLEKERRDEDNLRGSSPRSHRTDRMQKRRMRELFVSWRQGESRQEPSLVENLGGEGND